MIDENEASDANKDSGVEASAMTDVSAAEEAAKASCAEAAAKVAVSDSGVMKMIAQKARSLIPVRKTLVVVKDDDGKYECELHRFSANNSFKKAALSALFDKADEGEISIRKRSDIQYDLIVNGRVAYSAVEV